MRLSIPARIFGGFMVMLLVFSAVMAYTFHGMHSLRQDLQLINNAYLKLTLDLAELSAIQGNLPNKIDERRAGLSGSRYLRSQMREARRWRLVYVQRALQIVKQSPPFSASPRDRLFMQQTAERLEQLEGDFRANEAAFERLFAGGEAVEQPAVAQVAEKLLSAERKLLLQIRSLRDDLRRQVKSAALRVEENENNTAWAMLILAVAAILVSVAVTIGVQLTLRPLKGLVAGTKRIGRGDYAHRVHVRSKDELGLLAREFNSMAAAIEEREQRLIRSERMAAAGKIASHITHEIRNPLSSISLNTELLEDELEGQGHEHLSEARALLSAMRREIDRLTEITEEYLRFARLPRPQLQEEDLNEVLLDLLSFMSIELKEKRVELVTTVAADLPPVEVDENQLRQALLNLLRNAAEAMGSTGGKLCINTVARGAAVEVRITDSGPGIAKEHLPNIFEPFFSTKETGTGLGLALTQQIIQEHGGRIEVASAPGAGTTFTVSLPSRRLEKNLNGEKTGGRKEATI